MSESQSTSIVNKSRDRATFEESYDGKAPWDIGKPQRAIAAVADRVAGRVLDAGCGTGEHALFFAARGHRVTGIDFVESIEPVQIDTNPEAAGMTFSAGGPKAWFAVVRRSG